MATTFGICAQGHITPISKTEKTMAKSGRPYNKIILKKTCRVCTLPFVMMKDKWALRGKAPVMDVPEKVVITPRSRYNLFAKATKFNPVRIKLLRKKA